MIKLNADTMIVRGAIPRRRNAMLLLREILMVFMK